MNAVLPDDSETLQQIENVAIPYVFERKADPDAEIISLGSISELEFSPVAVPPRELPSDVTFTEGKRMRVTHIRVERSPKLRKLFLATLPTPVLCDMCGCNTNKRYPWTDNLLEVHHLLPLSSTLAFAGTETSFHDLIALCPNCHKSVHSYYAIWLLRQALDDFVKAEDAKLAYLKAKSLIRLD
jgi:predicted HNH restriction endonuclease